MASGEIVGGKQWFGHPRGLSTLFFTEMWERFSYYGMRALLVLFMTAEIMNGGKGGMGLDETTANAIYGLYTASVYLLAMPGGWIADRVIGQRRAVWYGGIIIALGHFSMAVPSTTAFFLGLVLIVIGTGLLKPNISTIVSGLYPEGGARQDAGFSIFYMGINIGAFLAPIVCGFLGEKIDWHLGFAAAGVGMVFGLIQYKLTEKHLGEVGTLPNYDFNDPKDMKTFASSKKILMGMVVLGLAILIPPFSGLVTVEPVSLAKWTSIVIGGLALAFFLYMLFLAEINSTERKQVGAILVLFIFSTFFWSGFEQAGSSLNVFAKEITDRHVFGWEMPASFLQAANPIMIVIFAPIYGAMWVKLASMKKEPFFGIKFAMGLILLGLGFAVMIPAANIAVEGGKPLPTWLLMTYFLHTVGELALSPVGLSYTTKLAPKKFVSQMMGVWFMSISLGNLVAGLVAGNFKSDQVEEMPGLFGTITLTMVGSGILIAILTKPLKKLAGKIH